MTTKKSSTPLKTRMRRCGIKFTDPTRTQQNFENETNINKIMARYKKTGYLPTETQDKIYGDFSEVTSYQEAIHKISEAENMFMALPATIRAQFSNDPAQFLDYVQNPENLKNLQELGLVEKPKVPLYGEPGYTPPPSPPKEAEKPPSPTPKTPKQSAD